MNSSPNEALIGSASFRSELNTPALGVDLDVLEQNIRRMSDLAKAHGMALRPHGKAHKSPRIAKMQIDAGAVGVCCATLGEADVRLAEPTQDFGPSVDPIGVRATQPNALPAILRGDGRPVALA